MIERIQPASPEVRVVSAIWGELAGKPDDGLAVARSKILDWVSKRTPEKLPISTYDGDGFSLALGNGEAISSNGLWALRFDTNDDELKDNHGIERRWRTEAVLARVDGHRRTLLTLRLSVVTDRSGVPFFRSAPTLIKELTRSPGLIIDSVDDYSTLESVENFTSFLNNRERRPVVALSQDEDGSTLADANQMRRSLTGLAHVVRVPPSLSWALTRRMGQEWSVHSGAIRVYMPGLDVENQDPRAHPLWLKSRFPSDANDRKRLVRQIYEAMLAASASRADLDDVAPGFSNISEHVRSVELKAAGARVAKAHAIARSAATEKERLRALEGELSAIRSREAALESEILSVSLRASQASQERDYAYQTAADHESEIHRLRAQIFAISSKAATLEKRLEEVGSSSATEITYPSSFEKLSEFVLANFPDRMVVLPKAQRAARKAVFADYELIYRCLHLLATQYVDMRRGAIDAKRLFEAECERLRVEVSGVGDALDDRRYKEQFRAPYRTGQIEFDLHLAPAKGTSARGSFDPLQTYRIYFAWDYEDQVVVLGSLPAHLDTSLTS